VFFRGKNTAGHEGCQKCLLANASFEKQYFTAKEFKWWEMDISYFLKDMRLEVYAN